MSADHDEPILVSAPFAALVQAFAAFTGLPGQLDEHAFGVEFDAGPHAARVLPHPLDDGWLQVEVEVCSAAQASARPLAMLHGLNSAARFEHRWLICIDADDTLLIHTGRALASTDAGALEGLIVDGLERAQALAALWQSALDGDAASASPAASEADLRFAGIRA